MKDILKFPGKNKRILMQWCNESTLLNNRFYQNGRLRKKQRYFDRQRKKERILNLTHISRDDVVIIIFSKVVITL